MSVFVPACPTSLPLASALTRPGHGFGVRCATPSEPQHARHPVQAHQVQHRGGARPDRSAAPGAAHPSTSPSTAQPLDSFHWALPRPALAACVHGTLTLRWLPSQAEYTAEDLAEVKLMGTEALSAKLEAIC